MNKPAAVAALVAALTLAGPAAAEDYNFRTHQGPVTIQVHRSGRVEGYYPWNNGKMVGRVERNGDLSGLWLQSKSERTCREQREGSFYWGRFYITNPNIRPVRAFYAYCGERPTLDWGFRNERDHERDRDRDRGPR